MPVALLILYCTLIIAASVAGGLLPMWLRLTHQRMQVALSFVSGVMLGVAFLHLLTHAWLEWREARGENAAIEPILLWLLGGFLTLFLLERFFAFHHHEPEVGNSHDHHGQDGAHAPRERRLSWSGAFLGLAVHSILNGVALAASVAAGSHSEGGTTLTLAGLATFLVIFLHKPFDALTIGTLMAASARPAWMRHAVNAMFALMVPLGAGLFGVGLQQSEDGSAHAFIAAVLALSAGMFICIALSDLLPELHFHAHDRIKLTIALCAGLLLAYAISLAEGTLHHHDDGGPPPGSADAGTGHID
jgi:zinc and cadmium transporter